MRYTTGCQETALQMLNLKYELNIYQFVYQDRTKCPETNKSGYQGLKYVSQLLLEMCGVVTSHKIRTCQIAVKNLAINSLFKGDKNDIFHHTYGPPICRF